jgi:hypothetical protein
MTTDGWDLLLCTIASIRVSEGVTARVEPLEMAADDVKAVAGSRRAVPGDWRTLDFGVFRVGWIDP